MREVHYYDSTPLTMLAIAEPLLKESKSSKLCNTMSSIIIPTLGNDAIWSLFDMDNAMPDSHCLVAEIDERYNLSKICNFNEPGKKYLIVR